MVEIWKDVKDYEGLYQVSNLGRVKVLEKRNVRFGKWGRKTLPERIKLSQKNKNGYYMIDLIKDKSRKRVYVHRLVAQAFVANPDNLQYVNHKDEDKTNNRADNLEWCTKAYNNNYGTKHARMVATRMKNNSYRQTYEHRMKISKSLREHYNNCKRDK